MHNILLPYPPSINDYYSHTCIDKRPHLYIKTHGKKYRKQIIDLILKNNMQLRANIPLKLTIKIIPPDNRRRDIDNILKCLLDALTHAEVYEDDSLIKQLNIEKLPPIKDNKGYVAITLERYTHEP